MRWLLVDRIDELVVGERVVGAKAFTYSEPFFQDHLPYFPVVPGVLMLESMAQIAGKLIGQQRPGEASLSDLRESPQQIAQRRPRGGSRHAGPLLRNAVDGAQG